jgi:exosortase D (VPLPA-CTERM-specific)
MKSNRFGSLVLIGLVTGAVALLYRAVLADLVRAWIGDGNYSHGFLIPPVCAYFLWERRAAFRAAPRRPSAWGLALIAVSLAVLLAGLLGSEFFLSRISLLGVIAGLVLFLSGWPVLRIAAFPIAFLVLMIPLPAIVFNQIALPLQFLASRAGEWVIDACGIPVLREGNVLHLANTTLEVAEACSGIRSLVSLITLGLVFGYFTDARFWVRATIVLATIPVAVVANAARVAGTGLLASWVGPEAAEGFFHEFSGWIVFVVAFVLIFGLQRLIVRMAPKTPSRASVPRPAAPIVAPPLSTARSVAALATLVVGIALVGVTSRRETAPPRDTFGSFPMRIGDWRGVPEAPFSPEVLAVLGATDYVTRSYFEPGRTGVGLYIGYWQSQRQGETIHSPLNCLPGSGWEPVSKTTFAVDPSEGRGAPMAINRYLIQKGLDRELVFYWYQSHGRVVASEYASKWYLMTDAMRLNRTDGAIVRVTSPILADGPEAEAKAERLALEFIMALTPQLPAYLPN